MTVGRQVSAWETIASVYQTQSLRIRFAIDDFQEFRIGTIVDVHLLGQDHRTKVESISQIGGENVAIAPIPETLMPTENVEPFKPDQLISATVTRRESL